MKDQPKIPFSISLRKEQERSGLFDRIYTSMIKGLRNVYSKVPRKWLINRLVN